MGSTLHVVASCTDLKRIEPAVGHLLRAFPHGPDRAEAWVSKLRGSKERRVAALDLYGGHHWTVCRRLESDATVRGWSKVRLWVASAGYGLVAATDPIASYSATFGARHQDSVPSSAATASADRRAWWRALTRRRTTIADLASEGALLVVGSAAYVDALHDDLTGALEVARRADGIVLVNAGRATTFASNTVVAAAPMRSELGGALTSLNARLARRIARALGPEQWTVAAARDVAGKVAQVAPPLPVIEREPMTDGEVRTFVRSELRANSAATATRSLRGLREQGRACEQKRFGRLFREEVASWRPAK